MISDDDTLDQSSPARQVKGPGAGSLLETVPSSSSETIEERPPVDPLERTASRQPHMGVVGEAPESLARIGRYAVLRVLGAGAMGVVLSAFDEELNRRVAVKILKSTESSGRERMVREAQAMARLSHPNVVQVYEVGEHNDQLFLVMEYIEGQTLGSWLRASKRSWQEVTTLFQQVARGLEAAHSADLIHRDLKPENVLVGQDGRARIVDFGLARTERVGDEVASHLKELLESRASGVPTKGSMLDVELTDANTLLGTPAYMSPEQYECKDIDARSDLFSLSVMLFEALHGHRPFTGRTLEALAVAILSGDVTSPPRDTKAPMWLHRVAIRGIEVNPEERWQSAAELARALARDPVRRRWTAGFFGLLGLGLAGIGYAAALIGSTPEPQVVECIDMAAELDEVWNDERRNAVRTAVLATDLPYAQGTWERVSSSIDTYAESWRGKRVAICEDQRTGKHSDEAHYMQLACLAQRRAGLDGLIEVFSKADAAVLQQAAQATASLPSLKPCSDLESLSSRLVPPPDTVTAVAVQRLREQLARARSYQDAGRYEDALALIDLVEQEAKSLDYSPLDAEIALRRGDTFLWLRKGTDAEAELTRSLSIALSNAHLKVAAHALVLRLYIEFEFLGKGTKARRNLEFLEPLAGRYATDLELSWLLEINLAGLYSSLGENSRALKHYKRALSISRAPSNRDTVFSGYVMNNLGNHHEKAGNLVVALREFRDSLKVLKQTLGPRHPSVSIIYLNIANVYISQLRPLLAARALARGSNLLESTVDTVRVQADLAGLRRAHSERVRTIDKLLMLLWDQDDHRRVSWTLRRGISRLLAGDTGGARSDLELGETHFDQLTDEVRVEALRFAGHLRRELGDLEGANGRLAEATEITFRIHGPNHISVAKCHIEEALTKGAHSTLADKEQALALFTRAERILARTVTPEHRWFAEIALGRANVLRSLSRPRQALAQDKHALDLYSISLPEDNPYRAHAQIQVARARVAAGEQILRDDPKLLAALEALRNAAPGFEDWILEDSNWIEELPT